jgi:hypothetical protein
VASFVKGVATATTTSGDDIVISGLSNPVAVLLWTSKQSSAAALDGDGEFYMGWMTFGGGVVQQAYGSFFDSTWWQPRTRPRA